MSNVVEFVMYKVSDVEAGLKHSQGIVDECLGMTEAIVAGETYQSLENPDMIVVRVVWSSLAEAKRVAAWVFDESPSMKALNKVTTETLLFDYFKEV